MVPVVWAAAAADPTGTSTSTSIDSSSATFAIDLMHIGCLGLSVCYMALALFPIVSLVRMVVASTCGRRREEHTPLVQRDFATEGAHQSPRTWVRWFHALLLLGALGRAAYFLLEGLVPWVDMNHEEPGVFIAESVLMWLATPFIYCCYIVVLGKWFMFLHEAAHANFGNTNSSRVSLSAVHGHCNVLHWSIVCSAFLIAVSVVLLGIATTGAYAVCGKEGLKILHITDSISRYVCSHHDNQPTITATQPLVYEKQMSVSVYFALSVGYGAFALRAANVHHAVVMSAPLKVAMRRVMALSAVLCLCYIPRGVLIIVMEKVVDMDRAMWIIFPFYIITDLLPLVLTIILFAKNQITIQLARQRRAHNVFG